MARGIRTDHTGKSYSFLTGVKFLGVDKKKRAFWLWKCICGKEVKRFADDTLKCVKNETVTSCGCKWDRSHSGHNFKQRIHGLCSNKYDERIHSIWFGIIERCGNKNRPEYKRYGGRGITICKQWLDDPLVFSKWAKENGYQPNLSIDRINNDGNYEPSNCRWVTQIEQMNNRKCNVRIVLGKENHTVSEWARILGCSRGRLNWRLKKGLTPEQILKVD